MEYIRTAEREFPVGDELKLEYEGRSGNIVVEGADTDRARVQIVAHISEESAEEADAALQRIVEGVRVEDGTLRITAPKIVASGFFFSFNRGMRIDYAVTVPRRTRARLASSSGRVEVARIAGPLDVAQKSGRTSARAIEGDTRILTKSGGTDLEEIGGNLVAQAHSGRVSVDRVAGGVKLTAHSGAVKLDRVGGNVEARTHSGRIEVTEVGGNVNLVSHSGRIRVAAPRGSVRLHSISGALIYEGQVHGNVEIESTSGAIHFDVDPARPFFMDAETVTGSIRSDLPPRRGEGPPPEGAPTVRLRTVSGAIRIGPRRPVAFAIRIDKGFGIDIGEDFDVEVDTAGIEGHVARVIEEKMARARERMERHTARAERYAERARRRAERQAERARRRAAGEVLEDDEDDEEDEEDEDDELL